ncbi:MAG: NADH:ubiquinone reductase (Na(+)-transporting) subunit F, partial [Candidatus Omnitrophota bacterium]
RKDLLYFHEFQKMEKSFPRFSFHAALSDPLPDEEWNGETGLISGVVYDRYLRAHESPEEIEYYLCGPEPMIEAARDMLDSLGVPPEMVAFDSFG